MSERTEGSAATLRDHACAFTVYSHTSYGPDDERDVMLCEWRDCPAWDYGPARSLRKFEGDINARQRSHGQPDNAGESARVTPSESTRSDGEAAARRIGICLMDYEMFWWRADENESCPVCSTDDEDYAANHRFYVAEEAS